MLPFILYFIYADENILAFILFLIAFSTDVIDGYIARKFNQQSNFGRVLDHTIDKVSVNSLALLLAFKGKIPVYIAFIIFSRDILITIGALTLIFAKTHTIPASNEIGKIAGVFFAILLGAGILNLTSVVNYTNYLVICFAFLSLTSYILFFAKKIFAS